MGTLNTERWAGPPYVYPSGKGYVDHLHELHSLGRVYPVLAYLSIDCDSIVVTMGAHWHNQIEFDNDAWLPDEDDAYGTTLNVKHGALYNKRLNQVQWR